MKAGLLPGFSRACLACWLYPNRPAARFTLKTIWEAALEPADLSHHAGAQVYLKVCSCARPPLQSIDKLTEFFDKYLEEFGIAVPDEEREQRLTTFQGNLRNIQAVNANTSLTWAAAPNQFTHLTAEVSLA